MVKFNVALSRGSYRLLAVVAGWLEGTMADAIREAIWVHWALAREFRSGHRVWVERTDGSTAQVRLPSIEMALSARLPEGEPS